MGFSIWGLMFGVIWGQGASRGILLKRDKMVVVKIKECVGIFSFACFFRSVDDNFEQPFACVYGPNDDKDKKML